MEKQVPPQPAENCDDLTQAAEQLLKEMEADWEADWSDLESPSAAE